jgi:hypothetical protein
VQLAQEGLSKNTSLNKKRKHGFEFLKGIMLKTGTKSNQ